MKESKFRVYDKIAKAFIYSDQVAGGMWRYFKTLEDRGIRHYESQQFTGLLDKRGKEIYEGDILKTSTGNDEVMWDNKDGLWCFDERCPVYFADINQREIIGNIYDNPELLANNP